MPLGYITRTDQLQSGRLRMLLLQDPTHPVTPGNNTDDVSKFASVNDLLTVNEM